MDPPELLVHWWWAVLYFPVFALYSLVFLGNYLYFLVFHCIFNVFGIHLESNQNSIFLGFQLKYDFEYKIPQLKYDF